MSVKSFWRGHKVVWKNKKWLFEDTMEPVHGYGGEIRPCKKCGKLFEGSYMGDEDPCLGKLPGVDNACCGHGEPREAYIRFKNGTVIKGFTVEVKGTQPKTVQHSIIE